MHIKITSVRSYKKQWCVETQTQTNSYDEVYFLNDWNLMCDYWCSVDQKGKLTCENSLYYSWINYFSATSITRTKVIFHSTNVFVNLVKLMKRVKKREEKRENYVLSIMKSYHSIWVMSLYIWLEKAVTSFSNFSNNLDQAHPSWADQA